MDDRAVILVVDDDPVQRLLIAGALEEDYRIAEAGDGESVLERTLAERPALILMDIRMTGIDGYEACRRLRADFDVGETPVLFLSAEVTREDRLAAYEAGGEDFIGKPFDPVELVAKVAVTLKNVAERQRLAGNAREAFQTAMTAMSSASEMGVVIQALRQSFGCHDLVTLADAILAACREYELNGCVRLASRDKILTRNLTGEATPVEAGVLANLADGDRIFSMGRQSAYHYGGVTLLIKNMPVDNPERMGRLRDNLALIAEGCEARLLAIEAELANTRQKAGLRRLMDTSFAALEHISQRHALQREQAEVVLNKLTDLVEDVFLRLGLTAYQEDIVSGMVRDAASQVVALYDQGLDIDTQLEAIRSGLEDI